MRTDDAALLLAMQGVMTAAQQQVFLDYWTAKNPQWRGANVADILGMLHESDTFAGTIDRFWNEHRVRVEPSRGTALALAIIVLETLMPGHQFPWTEVDELARAAEMGTANATRFQL